MFGKTEINIEEQSGGLSKYVSYGNQELTITGFELKPTKKGDKHQVKMLVETRTVTAEKFKADETAINGGKVGRVEISSYIDFSSYGDQVKKFETIIQTIAKAMGVYPEAKAIQAATIGEYLDKIKALFKGKYAWFTICAKVYAHEDGKDKYSLVLPMFKYVGESEDKLQKFNKENKYHYIPMKDADKKTEEPVTTESNPW